MTERDDLEGRFESLKGANLNLDLTRGKPAAEQLDLADELDGCLGGNYVAEDGTDVRNYGMLRACRKPAPWAHGCSTCRPTR